MLPANQHPLCSRQLQASSHQMSCFLSCWFWKSGKLWLLKLRVVLEIWIAAASETWFILETKILLVPETWIVFETSIGMVSKSLSMWAKIVSDVCRGKIWIILASKSPVMPTKIALHVHGSKCCKTWGDSIWENVKTQTNESSMEATPLEHKMKNHI